MAHDFEVLDANSAFYRAFAAHDLPAMEAVWAAETPVACIHPGWDALHGRQVVMESFRAILNGSSSPEIRCSHAFVQALGEIALVICREHVEGGELVATNVFVREGGAWKLVHHQASPLARNDEDAPEEAPN
ncbi:MAG TPA: nuclear transport factor 2 family protein [Anaeromyxobacteraceae bacterium]|nr:nuclear transport factor 2 family protein [Anaeromyxobacteraceae bacterium]